MNTDFITLLTIWQEQKEISAIQLLNSKHEIVGAIYLNILDLSKMVITKTTNEDPYFLYYDGLGIYFSFIKKVSE